MSMAYSVLEEQEIPYITREDLKFEQRKRQRQKEEQLARQIIAQRKNKERKDNMSNNEKHVKINDTVSIATQYEDDKNTYQPIQDQ